MLLQRTFVPMQDDNLIIAQLPDNSYILCWEEDLPVVINLAGTVGYWICSDDLLFLKDIHEEWVKDMSSQYLAGIQQQAKAAGYDRQSFEKWFHSS